MQVILGSGSERRKHILSFFSLPIKQITSSLDEKTVEITNNPYDYTNNVAKEKALQIAKRYPNDFILTADTVVYFNNKYLLKPENKNEALNMLKMLSENWHEIYTGVCVKKDKNIFFKSERTKILFHDLSEKQINKYHQNFYFADKAPEVMLYKIVEV